MKRRSSKSLAAAEADGDADDDEHRSSALNTLFVGRLSSNQRRPNAS